MAIYNPHDKFFRESFGRPEIARAYLQNYLPSPLLRQLDLTEMVLQDGSFVDEAMREHHSDLLYEVGLVGNGTAFAYLLFEHKSSPEGLTPLQLLRYKVNIWTDLQNRKLPLRPILPIVIYHGEADWHISQQFADLLTFPEEMRPYIPHFEYHLTNVSYRSGLEIKGQIILQVTLSIMRSIYNPNLLHQLPDLLNLLFQLGQHPTDLDYIRLVLYYMTKATGKVSRMQMQEALLAHGEQGEKVMKTIADEYIAEGFAKGIQQGLEKGVEQGLLEGFEQGLEQSILRILKRRFGGYGEDLEDRLGELPPKILELVLDEAVTAVDYPTFDQAMHQLETMPPPNPSATP